MGLRYEPKLQDIGTHHTEIQKQKKVENSFSGMLWYHREEKDFFLFVNLAILYPHQLPPCGPHFKDFHLS